VANRHENKPIVQVVPDLPTFAVDDGFAYRLPESLARDVQVGSMVRVPLSGRRVRGYVVGMRHGDDRGLKEVVSVSGELPVFTPRLLETLRWCAVHYVAPLAVLLRRAAPASLPRGTRGEPAPPMGEVPAGPVPRLSEASASGRHVRPHYLLASGKWGERALAAAGPVLAAGRSAMVVAPTAAEAEVVAGAAGKVAGERLLLGLSEHPDREQTAAWMRARLTPGSLVVGTRGVALWPVAGLALVIVVDEGRRGMKERQTPTVHVREVIRRRAAVERFNLLFVGRVPTTELLAAGVEVVRLPGRTWPLVEVVDRRDDPPRSGLISDRALMALHLVVKEGGRAFVFTHRRGYAPAFRCGACRTLRRCPACGARPERGDACPRCGGTLGPCAACGAGRFEPLGAGVGRVTEELRRVLGRDRVGEGGSGAPVLVGTERDLVAVPPVRLAVAVDADGLLLAPNYRAGEEGLRLLARLVGTVEQGSGRRSIVQTAQPEHPVIVALRRGDPLPYLQEELENRSALGFPPAGEIIVLEVREPPSDADARLREAVGESGAVLGPAERRGRTRWLIQGSSLGGTRVALRPLVQHLRDSGARVHVDVDPLDL
jgi:primosomal protein N' (replication factor Y)